MGRSPLQYHFLSREELSAQLLERCLRLRVGRPPVTMDRAFDGDDCAHALPTLPRAKQRYLMLSPGATGGPLELDPDPAKLALMRSLNELAALLWRLSGLGPCPGEDPRLLS